MMHFIYRVYMTQVDNAFGNNQTVINQQAACLRKFLMLFLFCFRAFDRSACVRACIIRVTHREKCVEPRAYIITAVNAKHIKRLQIAGRLSDGRQRDRQASAIDSPETGRRMFSGCRCKEASSVCGLSLLVDAPRSSNGV